MSEMFVRNDKYVWLKCICLCISQCSMVVRTVVRATQQVNGKWQFRGCQNSVTSVGELTSYAKFRNIRRLKGWPAIWWNIPLAYLFIFFEGDFLRASTEKNTEQFQALNGLKCSTVGNLGS